MANQARKASGAGKKVQAAPMASERDYVFVISQVGDKSSPERKRADDVLEYIVGPVAKEFDLIVRRSDLDPTPGQITTQIIKGIINARVIVADLTGRNPNVYFELGVAQSFAKPLILLVRSTNALPFDVKNERTIEIGDSDVLGASEAKEAARQLKASMTTVLADDYEPSNLVTEVAAARSLDALAPENPMASELSAVREAIDEIASSVRQVVQRLPRSVTPGDWLALRSFVEALTEADRLLPRELGELPNDTTSSRFEAWASKLAARADEVEQINRRQQYSYDEEPF